MELQTKDLKKYNDWSVGKLLMRAEWYFNLFIRLRDTNENGVGRCISSGRWLQVPSHNAHAGHFYPAGKYPELRFNEDNVHLQGKKDNFFEHSNALEYRKKLLKKIGDPRVQKLDWIADMSKKMSYKWDRFLVIQIIVTYRQKCKDLAKTKNFTVNGL